MQNTPSTDDTLPPTPEPLPEGRADLETQKRAELAMLDDLQRRWLPVALEEEEEEDDEDEDEDEGRDGRRGRAEGSDRGLKAVDRVLRISQWRARLLGWDGKDGRELENRVQLTLSEAEERLRSDEV